MNKHVKRVSNVDSSLKLYYKASILLLIFEKEVHFNMGRADFLRDNNDVFFFNLVFLLSLDLSNSDAFDLILEWVLFVRNYLCKENLPRLDQGVQYLV